MSGPGSDKNYNLKVRNEGEGGRGGGVKVFLTMLERLQYWLGLASLIFVIVKGGGNQYEPRSK